MANSTKKGETPTQQKNGGNTNTATSKAVKKIRFKNGGFTPGMVARKRKPSAVVDVLRVKNTTKTAVVDQKNDYRDAFEQ